MMQKIITLATARHTLEESGFSFSNLKAISEGSNHFIFRLELDLDGCSRPAILKFARTRETENGIVHPNEDTLFGGRLSLSRESWLFKAIRDQSGVPTPEVYFTGNSENGEYIIIQAMPGVSWRDWLKDTGYSRMLFLNSLNKLGRDFAAIQKISFPAFGNIMEEGIIEPAGLDNFADRWKIVLEMRISCAVQKKALAIDEAAAVKRFFMDKLEQFRPYLKSSQKKPVMNFTDMHAGNFFVDSTGTPSGYFDLESAQSAPAELEFYGIKFFLLNFYDKECMELAEKAFFQGYKDNGGLYAPASDSDYELIDFLSACRILELENSYWDVKDGIRDTWAGSMKDMLFSYMNGKPIDYMRIGSIWRTRDQQPEKPLRK